MRSDRTYHIRQAVLRACKECHPAPLNIDELADQAAICFVRPTRAELLEAWDGLAANGYLSVIPDSDGQYRAINAKGLGQINLEGDRDQFVWGAAAFRAF